MSRRMMHLGGFVRPIGFHAGWWRFPGGAPDANFSWPMLKRFAQTLEGAAFDTVFAADHLAIMNMAPAALARSATATSFDAQTLVTAMAAVTERIGLIATASTTYEHPFHVARRIAALDHLSGGRAGWNVVTTANPATAANFGMESHPDHADRYDGAEEFFDVVTRLWDGWADDALLMDQGSGRFVDPGRISALDHRGPRFSVKGPLNVARPVQGWPVIAQAGSSEAGRAFAAERAELIFTAQNTLEDGEAFYSDMRSRASAAGRDPDKLRIMPACFVVVSETDEAAQAKHRQLDSFIDESQARAALGVALGIDPVGLDLSQPLPAVPPSNASKSGRERALSLAAREGLTAGELGRRLAGYGALSITGSPTTIVDEMQSWFGGGACDGFIILFSDLPQGLDDFVNLVVPELRRRGLFRTQYEGGTLREHLGLPRIPNRRFEPAPTIQGEPL